jgi:hypothetical protein
MFAFIELLSFQETFFVRELLVYLFAYFKVKRLRAFIGIFQFSYNTSTSIYEGNVASRDFRRIYLDWYH